MYKGTLIEDLIGSVQKAEAHAAPGLASPEPTAADVYTPPAYSFTQRSILDYLLGVA